MSHYHLDIIISFPLNAYSRPPKVGLTASPGSTEVLSSDAMWCRLHHAANSQILPILLICRQNWLINYLVDSIYQFDSTKHYLVDKQKSLVTRLQINVRQKISKAKYHEGV